MWLTRSRGRRGGKDKCQFFFPSIKLQTRNREYFGTLVQNYRGPEVMNREIYKYIVYKVRDDDSQLEN